MGGFPVPYTLEVVMVTIPELWLPILVAAVLVFVASSVIHMLLGYHASDMGSLPHEDRVRAAFREAGVPPGDYATPRAGSMTEMAEPAFLAKQSEGPVAIITVLPSGPTNLPRLLGQWFLFSVVVGVLVAYVAGRTLLPGTDAAHVFRITGAVAFLAYALDSWPQSIWFGRQWSTTLKNTLDGFVYAAVTAAAFAWLWP